MNHNCSSNNRLIIIVSVIIVSFFLVGCNTKTAAQQDMTTSTKKSSVVIKETQAGKTMEEKTDKVQMYSAELSNLLNENKGIESYQYYLKSRIINKYGNYNEINYLAKVRGEKIKKTYSKPKKMMIDQGLIYFTDVYLDLSNLSAIVVCSSSNLICNDYPDAYKVDYSSEAVNVTPTSIIDSFSPDTKIIGTENLDGRKTTIISYTRDDGILVRVYIDNFYGVPLKYLAYKVVDENEEVQEDYHFNQFSVGVKKSEMVLPNNYLVKG